MKSIQSTGHFTHHEQQTLLMIRDTLADLCSPLMTFYIDSAYTMTYNRSICRSLQRETLRACTVRLVLIHESQPAVHDTLEREMNKNLSGRCCVRLIHCSRQQAETHLRAGSLFFTWLFNYGTLLQQQAGVRLPMAAVRISKRQYADQVQTWYRDHPDLRDGFTIPLSPMPEQQDGQPARSPSGRRQVTCTRDGRRITISVED